MIQHSVHLIGGGGLARDIIACFGNQIHFAGIWDDALHAGNDFQGIPVLGTLNELMEVKQAECIIAVGQPLIRKKIFENLKGKAGWATLIHPDARVYDPTSVVIGQGSILFPQAYLTVGCKIDMNCVLHLQSGLHHDAQIGAHSILMPGAKITCAANLPECSKLLTNEVVSSL
ncbi:MAG TPA: hypothetical protein DCF44_02330 [Chitinophagaceae bacterium]|nr:hypothetical protein [Chitinophagaceae bacterium]